MPDMVFEPITWILLALLGGWVGADSTGIGQLMISRPLVAATLAGWLAGSATAGAAAGLILEVFHLTVLPVGAARYPEGGPPAVAVGAVFAISNGGAAALLTALVFFLIWESVAELSVRGLRRMNSSLLQIRHNGLNDERTLQRRHLAAIGLDLVRGALLVVVGTLLLHELLGFVDAVAAPNEEIAVTALRLSVILLLAGAVRLFGRRLKLVAAGVAAGLLVLLLGA